VTQTPLPPSGVGLSRLRLLSLPAKATPHARLADLATTKRLSSLAAFPARLEGLLMTVLPLLIRPELPGTPTRSSASTSAPSAPAASPGPPFGCAKARRRCLTSPLRR
jgi:hypothetical protein